MTIPRKLKGLAGWDFTKPKSIIIPEGYSVTLTNAKQKIGPTYGRIELTGFCSVEWTEITVLEKSSSRAMPSAADMVVVCEGENFSGFCQQLGDEFSAEETRKNPLKFTGVKGN